MHIYIYTHTYMQGLSYIGHTDTLMPSSARSHGTADLDFSRQAASISRQGTSISRQNSFEASQNGCLRSPHFDDGSFLLPTDAESESMCRAELGTSTHDEAQFAPKILFDASAGAESSRELRRQVMHVCGL